MALTLAQMLAQVRVIIGETSVADFWTDAELKLWLNEGLTRFSLAEKWPWLVTEATGTIQNGDPELQLQDGVSYSRHINFLLSREGRLAPWLCERVLPAEGFKLRMRYYIAAIEPQWCYVTSVSDNDADGETETVARFIPTPTVDIDVEYQYYRTPSTLAGDSDVPDLPSEYHMAVVHYAAARAWEKELTDGVKAQEQDGLYAEGVAQAREEYLAATPDQPLVAGSEPPQHRFMDSDTYTRMRIPDTLGP